MTEDKDSFESRVKKEIEKTGLPTEIKATQILRENGWHVFNEYPYLDQDENKIRTLDILANKPFLNIKKPVTNNKSHRVPPFHWELEKRKAEIAFFCELYIECKKSEKHSWVFFTESKGFPETFVKYSLHRLAHDTGAYVRGYAFDKEWDIKNIEGHKSIFSRTPVIFENLGHKIALSQQSVFGGKEDFHEGVMKVLKSLSYEEKQKADGDSSEFSPKDIVIPIILFDGFLFECYYEEGQILTKIIDYVRYLAHGLPNQRLPALIDVMTLNYFPTYLKLIEKEFTRNTEPKKVGNQRK